MRTADSPSAALEDIELFEMVNLPTKDTGVEGIVYIFTAQGSHGARVKWYPGRPKANAPSLTVTVAEEPKAINNNLPLVVAAAAAGPVRAWVAANHDELLDFWNNGASWTRDEVNEFIERLKKLR